MMIGGWECEELYPGEEWCTREAKHKGVLATADAYGLDITESRGGYDFASGSVVIPANVIMWLMQAVR